MNESATTRFRLDEWSELLLLAMKTSLSVAHELGLLPDAVLDCAARHLQFHDFECFASAMLGASRAQTCCHGRRDRITAMEVAYIKTVAACIDSNRSVLACMPAMCASGVPYQVDAPAQAYERVSAAVQTLKHDVQSTFSLSGGLTDASVEEASGLARALAAITPADNDVKAYERALTAVLHVRFAMEDQAVRDDVEHHQSGVGHLESMHLPSASGTRI